MKWNVIVRYRNHINLEAHPRYGFRYECCINGITLSTITKMSKAMTPTVISMKRQIIPPENGGLYFPAIELQDG